MYLEFYHLKELPFALTPDPRFIYFTPSHTEAMANLHVGIEHGKGLIVVTGEVGTGKTTVLRWMMQRLERTVLVAYIFNPRLNVMEFYNHVAKLFDVQNWSNKSELLLALGRTLELRHERGLRTVLIIDEAHGLDREVLEEIRLLSNFESNSAKQLQIVLAGQPELRDVLNDVSLRQLKQRVSLRCEIKPMPTADETERYIAYRLLTAGAERFNLFNADAIDLIFRCSEGIPRQINNLCDNALLSGFALEAPVITREIVEDVADTFDMLPRTNNPAHTREPHAARTPSVLTRAGRTELWAAGSGEAASMHETTRHEMKESDEHTASPDSNLVEKELDGAFQSWQPTGN